MGRLYSRAMASNLRGVLARYESIFRDDKRIKYNCVFDNPNQTLYQFDSQCTARLGGYNSVEDYYLTAGSNLVLEQVSIPFLAVHAYVSLLCCSINGPEKHS